MSYPIELLPNNKYLQNMDMKVVFKNHPDFVLLRKSVSKILDKSNVKVREITIHNKDIFGLSTFSFGNYKIEHLKFKPSGRPIDGDYWIKGNSILNKEDIICTDDSDKVDPIYFKAQKIHSLDFPLEKNIKQITQKIDGKIHICHKATNTNYWHFELIVTDKDGNEYKREEDGEKNYAKRAAETFLNTRLKHLANGKNEHPQELKRRVYFQNSVCMIWETIKLYFVKYFT